MWSSLGCKEFGIERVYPHDEHRLPDLIRVAEASLAESDEETRSKAVMLLSVLPARQASGLDASLLLAAFDIGLRDIPNDLVEMATEAAIKKCKFRPSPAEVRAFVEEEMDTRRRRLNRLRANLRAVEEEKSAGIESQAYCPAHVARQIIEETLGRFKNEKGESV